MSEAITWLSAITTAQRNSVDGTAIVPLTRGKFSLVDVADLPAVLLVNWSTSGGRNTIYAGAAFGRKRVRLHRFLMGDIDGKLEIDHRNKNGLDNRKHNLRVATRTQNALNARLYSNNNSGHAGVYFRRRPCRNRWTAQVFKDGKAIYLGVFATKEQAIEARRKAVLLMDS